VADEIGFDWDEANIGHIARHDVKPEEAEQVVLNDPLELEPQMVDDEMRYSSVGVTIRGRWLFVASTVRKGKIRVATAYDAPRKLIALYLRGRG
jgi:uncharacterized DUF497 family protein